jgi:hypothetical protein
MKQIARDRGGACLSRRYDGLLVKLRWRCRRRHEWDATPNTILSGSWCPRCNLGMPDIDDLRALARERGGACLSNEYVNKSTKLHWRCALGHEWEASPGHVRRGSWCPTCAGLRQGIADMQELARAHGGSCESTTYQGNQAPLDWRCAAGHRFSKAPTLVRQGHWCPRCSTRQPVTLERLHAAAAARGGRCLDRKIPRGKMRSVWQCAEGHRWRAGYAHVEGGSWCPFCAGNGNSPAWRAFRLAEMRRLARQRGGRCLSSEFTKARKPLEWVCGRGHRFHATPTAVSRGRWCLVCRRLGGR